MRVTQRQSVLGLLGLGTIIVLSVLPVRIFTATNVAEIGIALVALIAFASLFIAYWRGWDPARYVLVLVITVLTISAPHEAEENLHIGAIISPILALVIANPAWVIGSAIAIYLGALVQGVVSYQNPVNALTYALAIGGLVLSRLVFETLAHIAEENARKAVENGQRAEQEMQISKRHAEELVIQNQQQKQLLDLIAVLETPAIPLADHVLFAPIIGQLDSRRTQTLSTRLLDAISQHRTQLLILDITGVNTVDTQVAQALMRTIESVRLLGCRVAITGISTTVAMTITGLGITFDSVQTLRTPQEALALLDSQRIGRN